ncbi:MAG: hypothetical protein ACRD4K_04545 [Candidatus Acidiferrales bacterium]
MPFAEVTTPVPAKEAFQRSDDAAILSQAATLLLLGGQIKHQVNLPVTAMSLQALPPAPALAPQEDLSALGVPAISATPLRFDSLRIAEAVNSRYALTPPKKISKPRAVQAHREALADLSKRFVAEPSASTAAELMDTCLTHSHELVRVAAAAAYFDQSSQPDRLVGILFAGTKSKDYLVRDVAATALARIAPANPGLQEIIKPRRRARPRGKKSHTTVLIHGTWARNSPWWQPGGDFFKYLTGVLLPLSRTAPLPATPPWDAPYAAADYYFWTGGYSDAARSLGAQDLVSWANNHASLNADMITHSHGGNVAFLASQMGLTMKEAVVLSCPVHFPKYQPDFTKIRKIVSVRVHLDLVILADLGGQKFDDPRIQENVLPVWFDHFATHDPKKWTKYNVPAKL